MAEPSLSVAIEQAAAPELGALPEIDPRFATAPNADDGGFRTREELEAIYQGEKGLAPDDDVIADVRRLAGIVARSVEIKAAVVAFPSRPAAVPGSCCSARRRASVVASCSRSAAGKGQASATARR